MKRKIEEKSLSILEDVVSHSLSDIGLEATDTQAALLLRLIFSGIGSHFFFNPDTKFRLGFIEVQKSPNLDELFNVNIIRSEKDKVINADTLYKYYKGDLAREERLKQILDTFVNDLLSYAQGQEINVAETMNKISLKRAKTRRSRTQSNKSKRKG